MDDLDDHPPAPSAPDTTDHDLTDEPQDFRFLTTLSLTSPTPTLPRRGEKDFEPHGTHTQTDILASSRSAMHAALSHPRVHNPKTNVVGILDIESGETVVAKPTGTHFRTMGRGRRGRGEEGVGLGLGLVPEEALYLCERGGLEIRMRGWGGKEGGGDGDGDDEEEKGAWPMSLQAAYAYLVGRGGLTLERYVVYAGLKRSGYIVVRAPGWDGDSGDGGGAPVTGAPVLEALGMWSWLYKALFKAKPIDPPPLGPLVRPGLYRSYNDIYRRLSIIPWHDPSLPSNNPAAEQQPRLAQNRDPTTTTTTIPPPPLLRPCFHVYKPSPTFRKSCPGPPDFYIAVLNARVDSFPTLAELSDLLRCTPYSPPPPPADTTAGKLYQKLGHGYRNVMIAVVDQGVVSYVRIADAGFGKERVCESAVGRGGRGGKRGGMGRGRGGARGGGRR